jgi:2'-5' RNA ligase
MRAFVAADVTSVAAISKFQQELADFAGWNSREVKPIEPQNLHFTLMFLGEITESGASNISSKVAQIHFQGFDLRYLGVGAFPSASSARVIWAGLDTESGDQLTALATKVVSSISDLGFTPDKPFSPHLTIFRVKRGSPLNITPVIRNHSLTQIGTDRIERIHLKKSELMPSGPVYSNVYTVEADK